jgi:hypothetical protein
MLLGIDCEGKKRAAKNLQRNGLAVIRKGLARVYRLTIGEQEISSLELYPGLG